ncbi:non-ribosomal peptide synthetase [Azospirillum griseum]|nr:non-ribosomal peptide synthetase [Azospirillum griseum]
MGGIETTDGAAMVERDGPLADALLVELAARDIRLTVKDGRLGYDAPAGAFDDALKARVRALRPALIARLSGQDGGQDRGLNEGATGEIVAPLTFGQERMWFLNRLDLGQPGGARGGYTEHLAFDLVGSLDHAALDRALTAVAARHGALRTRFEDGPDGPVQRVAPPAAAALPAHRVDLRATPDALERALDEAAHRPIDLATDPHARVALFTLADDHHVLSLSAHHAAWDGWSNGLFAADLATAYNAARAGRPADLPPLVRDMADLARAQRAALASGGFDAALERLRRRLDGHPTHLTLPTDHPRPAVADGRGAALALRLEPDAAGALAAAARRAGATPYMAVLAAWALLLSRLSGAPRLLIGAPVAARADEAEEAIIGYLSNSVAIPVDVGAAGSFGALVEQVRDRTLDVMADQDVPFDKLVEALAPPRSRATTPLVQTMFAMQPRAVPAPALGGLAVTVRTRHNEAARYELTLNLETTADGALDGPLTYATALFDAATVVGWADWLCAFLRAAPGQWSAPLDRSPLVTPAKATTAAITPAASSPVATPVADGFATPTERALAALWAGFLATPPTARDDDFFVLGGHSLLLMRVVNAINSDGSLGRIELAEALGATRLMDMAALLDGGQPALATAPTAAAPLEGAAEEHPANPGQEGMWLTRRDEAETTAWSVPLVIPLARHAEAAVVRAGLERLAARHPALRTTLCERDGAIRQRIAPHDHPGLIDLTVHHGLDAAARFAVMKRDLARPMDLERGPLYRFHLFTNGDGAGELFLNADHTLIDGWSLDVLRRDVVALIDAAATGRGDGLPALACTPVALTARRLADTRRLEADRAYWLDTLRGMELGDLPAPGSRPPGAPPRGLRTQRDLSAATMAALDRIARAGGTTPTVALIAAASALMIRLKGDGRDVSVATPFAGRTEPEHADLVGCFVEVLPLRFPGGLERSFADHLAAARRALTGALAHQTYPLRHIMKDTLAARGGDPTTLYDVVAVLENAEPQTRDWFDPRIGGGKYDLAFIIGRMPDGSAVLTVEHDEWLYDAQDALAMAARLETLLCAAADRPDAALGDLAVMPEDERRLVLSGFNDTAAAYPRDASMADLWARAAAEHADRVALRASNGDTLTYAALDQRAGAIAAALLGSGPVGPTVALAVQRGFDAVAAILGIWKAGAAYLPLDSKLPPAVVTQLMTDAEARIILADATKAATLSGLPDHPILRLDSLPSAPAPADASAAPPVVPDGGAPAYVMFTSGTTGTPKGVVVPHRGIARLALNRAVLDLRPQDVMGQLAPLAFDAKTLELWSALLNGASLRVFDDEELLDPQALGRALVSGGVTVLWLTAGLFNRAADEAPHIFRPLRLLMSGGEALSPPHLRRVMAACPDLCLLNGYGPTENSCLTTLHTITTADLDGAIPIGRPISNCRVFVVDDRLTPVPVGVWGELLCGGDGVALGYAGRPDLTAASFVSPPWAAGERLYRSGDIVRWRRDGVIEFLGRRDGQVKIRGHRIETGAIEAVLSGCADVRDAAVLVTGSGADKALVACVAADSAAGEGAWRRTLAERLPIYMMPARFIVVPALPVNANGKRDRRAVQSLVTAVMAATAPALAMAAPTVSAPPRPAASPAETLVLRLFAEQFPGVALDPSSDFFHLGGHSMTAMRLSARLVEECGARVSLRALFAARTVAAIAALLPSTAAAAPTATGSAETLMLLPPVAPHRAEPADGYPLSTGQERLWVMQRLFPDSGVYNIPLVFDVDGDLNADALARALTALEERHHALRLRVVDGPDGRPRQRLYPVGALVLHRVDLSAEADPVAAATARQSAELHRPFALEREAGARALLMRLGAARWRVLLVLHHAIMDGWSAGVLMRDLAAFYSAALTTPAGAALTIATPAPAVQFQDVAAWQRAHADSAEGKALLARWVGRLTPRPEPLALPTDHRRPPVKSFRGDTVEHAFDAALSAALDRLARAESATPFAVVTALVQALLHRMTGQTDMALGTLVAGRDRAEVQDTVGFFVNTLVLRQSIDPEAGFRRLLADTRGTCLHAVADQHCPFESLVEATGAPRDLGRNPLFDVLVVWQSDDGAPPSLPGLTTHSLPVSFPFAKFDLGFHFGRRGDRIICQLEHSADLFDADSAAALFARLEHLAAAVLADPDRRIRTLPILPDGERAQLARFNDTATPLDTRRSLTRLLLDQTARSPGAPALLWNGQAPLSYRDFAARAGAVARRLVAAGVKPGDSVAICAPRGPELLIGIHGILMAGAGYAPLGADQPPARLAGMLEDLGHPLVLTTADTRARLGESARCLDLSVDGVAEPLDLGGPDGLAYVLFTSGSTGRPKGVAVEQHAVVNRVLWMQSAFPIGPGDVILQKTPVTFDVSVWELLWWGWTGAAVALPPPGAERDPQTLVDLIARDGVTVLHFVPSMLAAFLTCLEDGRADAAKLARLRFVFASGEALDPALVERFDRLLHRRFGTQLHNLYGPTEATVDVTWHPCSPWTGGAVVPIGKPIANTTVDILDADGAPLPIGMAGEIHLGGPQVARGYVNRPDLTAKAFIADPNRPGGRLYRTGDLGRWRRDGTIEYLGRIDHQVKVRGQRIEPGEIEHALERHPGVERAVVVPVAVNGLTELHGYILPRDPALTTAALRAHLRDRVTEAMIPARFLRLDALPLTSSGKLDRKALTGAPLDRPAATVAPAAPSVDAAGNRSAVEAAIRAIWKDLLPDADPGPRDGFFDAGGNSLLVIRLHERLNARWPGVFGVADLFACATIAEQAQRIAPTAPPASPVLPTPPTMTHPPTTTHPVAMASPAGATFAGNAPAGAIAIVGMALRLPGSEDLAGFWRDVSTAADRVRPLPDGREADTRAVLAALGLPQPDRFREAAYLDDVMGFEPKRLRLSPADAALLDPEQRLFLETALRALEDAGRGGAALDDARVGVFVGGVPGTAWRDALMRGAAPNRVEQIFALNVASNIATRLSFLHNWRGPAALIDTACSASLAAVHTACRALRNGECEWALVGGAKILLTPPAEGARLTIDSSTGRTRAFAEGADGTGMGEGAVAFLLRPLADALADGDAIHGVILGSAINQDGASSGMAAPNPAAQAEVIAAATRDAGVSLASLSYIEAHGTGTALGDPIEIDGLTRAAATEGAGSGFAAIGSAKGNFGHLDGAAGALGLARALACLIHDRAPPQPFFTAPNPRIDFAKAPVAVASALTPLADRGGPRRAGVSAFGLSGINAHVVIEAAPRVARNALAVAGWFAIGLSAPDAERLRGYAGAVVAALRAHPDWPLADIARTLTDGRDALDARLAVWVRDRGDLMARLAVFAAAPDAVDGLVLTGTADRANAAVTHAALSADEESALAAATAFVTGARLSWPSSVRTGRVHLPAAPLARRRCLPDLTALSTAPAQPAPTATAEAAFALLGPAVVTAQGVFHRVDAHAAQFWPVAEHRLNGAPTLVGMGFAALVADAMGDRAVCIADLRWLRPLRPADLVPGTVTLTLAGDGAASLSGRALDGRWQSFVTATVTSADTKIEIAALDLAAIAARCAPAQDAPPFHSENGVVEVSARWNCLERVAAAEAEALAWLRVPSVDAGLRLHPGLLDVATGVALTEGGMVPTGCARIDLLEPLPADPVAHIERRVTEDGAEADVVLADRASGRVVARLLGLRWTRLARPQAVAGKTSGALVPALPVWESAPLAAADPGGPVVLIGEGALANRLADHLARAGRLAAHSGSETVTADALARVGASDRPVILFAPQGGADVGPRAARAMRAVLGALTGPTRLLALVEGAFAVEDNDPLDPFQALTIGVIAAATLEDPNLIARCVDCDDAIGPAALLAELTVLERDPRAVAWRRGRRLIRHFQPMELVVDAAALRDDAWPAHGWPDHGVCVVTGGTGGLSLMLADTLAVGGKLTLALLSRGGEPTGDDIDARRRRDLLDGLRAAGLRAVVYPCDIADRAGLSATLARIRADLGPITAVVHNAGVADGAFLAGGERAVAAYTAALAAKVEGARLLDELTDADPVAAFVMAGSLTGLTGAVAHAAYTGANAFLDTLAAARVRRGKPALTIDWCGIREVGMAARLLKGRSVGVDAGPADVGPLLRRALAARVPQVAILDPTVSALLAPAPAVALVAAAPVATPASRPGAKPSRSGAGRALEAALAAVWADVLGYDSVAPDDDFYALGGDSIAGMQIVEQVTRDLGQRMSLVDLFETGTVAALAERLRSRAAEQRPKDDALQPAPQRDHYPVAWEQLAVLHAEAAADMGTAYNLPNGLHLPPDVDMDRLGAALDALVARHEILRTRLIPAAAKGDEPTMAILPPGPVRVERVECPTDAGLLHALNATVRPFDLWNGEPPVRILLGFVAGRPRAVLLDVHHSLADAFSMEVLQADLIALYTGSAGPAPTIQLKDYAWWTRSGAGATAPEQARGYWLERFKGPLPVLDLPADHPRPARHTWRAETTEFPIAWDTVSRLRAFAAERRTTPFAVVTAAWALLLARYARTEDLVFAVPVNAREGAAMATMTGMLVTLLPLRLGVHADDRVSDLIQRTHTAHAEAMRNRAYGLGRLLADLAPPASPDRALLSEVTLSYMNFADGAGQSRSGDGLTPFGLARHDGKSDLGLYVRDLPDQMVMAVEYYADLFDRERMERMGRHFRTLLTALVSAAADTPVATLPLSDDEERAWLAGVGVGPTPPLPLSEGLFGALAQRAAANPDAVALEGSGGPLSYGDLLRRAAGVARTLREAGLLPGDRVALHVERDRDAVALLVGCVAAGVVYVPLDPAYPAERIGWIVEDAACRAVIADAAGRALLAPLPAATGRRILAAEGLVGLSADSLPRPPASGPAYVMYTSGSTGTPKGVVVTQAGILRLALGGGDLALTAADRVLQTGPLAFDASTYEIWGALLNGACLAVASRDAVLDPDALSAAIAHHRTTVLWLTTGLFNRQVDAGADRFRGLRLVITGGEAMSVPHAARALRACPDVVFVNGYGPTENTTFTAVHRVTVSDVDPGPVPLGRPIAHTSVRIVEAGGGLAPVGVWGDLLLGGLGLAEGYLNRADLTADRFVTDPVSGERLYRTGDLGRWRADGALEFGGRRDGQIKLRGYRIELEEIEAALNAHPAIADGAVLFLPDPSGEGDGALVACVQPKAEAPSSAALRDWLGRRLPAYMTPRRFVTVSALPVTENGKIDRRQLAASLPPVEANDDDAAGDPPRDASETLVAEVFTEVFGRKVADRDANFLDLGGHSLLAIKVVNRIAQATGVRLSMRSFFAVPTVAGLAALIAEGAQPSDGVVRVPDAPSHPASHAQARLYLASRMQGDATGGDAAYNITFALPFGGALDPEALRTALARLADRHETLRTGFDEEDGAIRQRIAASAVPPLAVDDLSASPDPRGEALRVARREAATPFDLATPPLLRARAIRLGASVLDPASTAGFGAPTTDGWLVLLVLHHIVGDGWSSRILLRELGSLYRAALAGNVEAAGLPALPVAYRDYAAWQTRRDWADSARHWRSVLADAPDSIALPADHPAPAVQSHRGDTVSRRLPLALVQGIAAYARQRGASSASVSLAMFAGLLYRLTRQGDLVIGFGVAGRDRAEVEGLIGFFVNVLPLRVRIGDETEFGPLVDQVHTAMMSAMDHRDFPFDLLVRSVAPRRVANRQPLINVVFEYQRFEDLDAEAGCADALGDRPFGDGQPVDPAFGGALQDAIRTPTAKHDLLLFFSEQRDGGTLTLEFDTDLFDRATAERWLAYLEQFASMVVNHANANKDAAE